MDHQGSSRASITRVAVQRFSDLVLDLGLVIKVFILGTELTLSTHTLHFDAHVLLRQIDH